MNLQIETIKVANGGSVDVVRDIATVRKLIAITEKVMHSIRDFPCGHKPNGVGGKCDACEALKEWDALSASAPGSATEYHPQMGCTVTNYHLSQSIRGPLTNWDNNDWAKATQWITKNDGGKYTVLELKQQFLDELAKGHEVVPIGECDKFDWKKGCLGHEVKSPNAEVSPRSQERGAD